MSDVVETNPSGSSPALGQPSARLLGTRRELLLGAACLTAAAVTFIRKPRKDDEFMGAAKLDAIVPAHFAGWSFVTASGLVLPPQDQLQSKLYHQLLTRVYNRADGQSIMLLIAYGGSQDGVVQIHRPEICYPASGYTLTAVDDHLAKLAPNVLIPSRFIIADSPSRKEQMIYWTRLGSDFPRRWSEQRLSVFEQNMAGIIPDGVLVRISSDNADASPAILDSFAADLYGAAGGLLRRLLVGQR
jgi:EpsI family protein